ncbi:hypothetical protein ZEAMMB73_Zm00001d010425 [Zea mays]|uniref:Uncharacterized protein n=1 Tax=Zea mays TaxID=4577 RepID=A0A1D6FQY6_MAIZE|nr:hypothetical protein ZEAMMB73_Zm00001d010425 [Zea mays]
MCSLIRLLHCLLLIGTSLFSSDLLSLPPSSSALLLPLLSAPSFARTLPILPCTLRLLALFCSSAYACVDACLVFCSAVQH